MATVRDTSTENKINIVTTTENNVTVTQPSIQTVEVLTGPIGPAGQSSIINTGSFATTGSNTFIGNQTISGSAVITSSLTASGLNYPTVDGDEKQLLSTDSEGRLSFDWADRTNIDVKNTSGVSLTLGTPIYITGYQGASIFQIAAASASDATKMPSIGVLDQDLSPNGQGYATLVGALRGYSTTDCNVNDSLYVGEGLLTKNRPTGSSLVQKIARVGNVANNGEITILGAGRTNDIPNITPGYTWVGNNDSVAVPTPTSSFAQYSNSTTATYTSANILALDEVSILPTLPSGQYYEYKFIIEYNFGTIPYSVSGFGGGIIQISSLGNVVSSLGTIPTTSSNEVIGFAQGITKLGSALKITIRVGSIITNGDGNLSIKIQYNTATFG